VKARIRGLTLVEAVVLVASLVLILVITVSVLQRRRIRQNESAAATALRTLHSSAYQWYSDGRLGPRGRVDSVAQVAGLYLPTDVNGNRLKIVDYETARADAQGSALPSSGYLFDLLQTDESGTTPYSANRKTKVGFVAYPAVYGKSGLRTFVVNENGSVYGKDIGTVRLMGYPGLNPIAKGWAVE